MLEERAERTRERDGLRAENDELERRVAELRRRQNEFETNPEYVELTARRENRTKSGETVFDFGEGGPEFRDGRRAPGFHVVFHVVLLFVFHVCRRKRSPPVLKLLRGAFRESPHPTTARRTTFLSPRAARTSVPSTVALPETTSRRTSPSFLRFSTRTS